MQNFKKTFYRKKIIITGHTGFKGSWLTLWLESLGAKVVGISNTIPTSPSHYKFLNLNKKIKNKKVDLSQLEKLKKIFKIEKPDFIFHLAAQALVKKSFMNPKLTFQTNTIGTLNILECLSVLKKKCTAVLITSDKVYKNLEFSRGYHEDDILGGFDPYSSSKGCAELVIQSYIKSFFSAKKNNKLIAIARAGNVIGGGDWSKNRLIPDCIKSWSKKKIPLIRNPQSTRPWQHVIEALYGYLILAKKLEKNRKLHGQAFNFGPNASNNFSVNSVIKLMKNNWGAIKWKVKKTKKNLHHESKLLKLNSNKAKKLLKWNCILTFSETMKLVTYWYKAFYSNKKPDFNLSLNQIRYYEKKLKKINT